MQDGLIGIRAAGPEDVEPMLADKDNQAALEFYRSAGWSATALVALRKHPL